MSHREALQKDALAKSVVTREKEVVMDRRWFLQVSAGAVAMSTLNGYTPSEASDAYGSPLSSRQITASEFHKTRRFAATPQGRIAYVERGRGPAALFLPDNTRVGLRQLAVPVNSAAVITSDVSQARHHLDQTDFFAAAFGIPQETEALHQRAIEKLLDEVAQWHDQLA